MNIGRLPNRLRIPQKFRAATTPVIALASLKARESVLTAHTRNLILRTDPVARRSVIAMLEETFSVRFLGAAGAIVEEAEERA